MDFGVVISAEVLPPNGGQDSSWTVPTAFRFATKSDLGRRHPSPLRPLVHVNFDL